MVLSDMGLVKRSTFAGASGRFVVRYSFNSRKRRCTEGGGFGCRLMWRCIYHLMYSCRDARAAHIYFSCDSGRGVNICCVEVG